LRQLFHPLEHNLLGARAAFNTMKCKECDKPATFHITEITDEGIQELHLCEDHARQYLSHSETPETMTAPTLAGVMQQLKVGQTAEELARLDQRSCPACGITFYEFRSQGRLGCPNDYEFFVKELMPLIENIHGKTEHQGKHPQRSAAKSRRQTDMIRLRREMKEAVEREEYELASELRDKIQDIEGQAGGA
jgi:protein arginine kinase activator